MSQVADVVAAFERRQRQAATATATAVMARWSMVDPDAIVESWVDLLDGVVPLATAGQIAAAEAGAGYTSQAVRAQGAAPAPAGQINARALAGVASDGRPLETLLALPAVQSTGLIGQGLAPADALAQKRRHLGMLVATQVLDAGRAAASVGMVADRQVGGYRRQITPPACSRCAILAGAWYRWNQGFLRHPSCQCVHVPAVGGKDATAGLETFDPDAYFESLDPADQDRIFTQAGAEAIRDGADMGQVVNARRGMKATFDERYGRQMTVTLEGTTRRGAANREMRERNVTFSTPVEVRPGVTRRVAARPMPEEIYKAAAGDRELAIRALGQFGYLTS